MLVPLLTTFGLAIVIQNLLLEKFSPDVRSLGGDAGWITTASWQITNQISIPAIGALALVVAIATLGGLQLYLSRTPSGRRMRATAQDPDTAELVGIDSRSVYAWGTAIAVGTAALAGMFLAMRSTFDPYAGSTQLIFAFEAVVIGGLGSLWGTLVGGIVLGVVADDRRPDRPAVLGPRRATSSSSPCWPRRAAASSARGWRHDGHAARRAAGAGSRPGSPDRSRRSSSR